MNQTLQDGLDVQQLQPATITGLRKALEIFERVDHSRNAELERCAPFAIGFAKSAISWVFRDLGLSPVQCGEQSEGLE